jgi:hypothetical protein
MAGEVSAAQIGEHITMPVAILSDDDDAGPRLRPCRRENYVPVFGLLLPDRTRTACIWGLRRLGTKSSQTLRWREMDSNYWYRSTKAVDFRSIPGIARVSAGLVNDTT